MAALDFTSRTAVLAYLTDALPTTDESLIEALLDASAGTNCDTPPVTTYRPFWVQANVLGTDPQQVYESVTSAAGSSVTYRDTSGGTVRGLMRRQAILDKSICDIPDGYGATGGNIARVVF